MCTYTLIMEGQTLANVLQLAREEIIVKFKSDLRITTITSQSIPTFWRERMSCKPSYYEIWASFMCQLLEW